MQMSYDKPRNKVRDGQLQTERGKKCENDGIHGNVVSVQKKLRERWDKATKVQLACEFGNKSP